MQALKGKVGPVKHAATDVRPLEAAADAPAPLWHAAPGEISERMWGEGNITPGDEVITDLLITPVYLTKEMSVLDLSAGLGGRLRRTTAKFGVYVTGLEPDKAIAARGMALSVAAGKARHAPIAPYDPATFAISRRFDCIIARETFYRVADKAKFFAAIAACAKPRARLSFTDYIADAEVCGRSALRAWRAYETDAAPLGLADVTQAWAKHGIEITVRDDQSVDYAKEVRVGLKRLETWLAAGVSTDAETRGAIRKRVETWAFRLAAMEQGMKFYRFFGTMK